MENPLQETAGGFSLWGMKLKTYLALTISSLLSFSAAPAIAEDCPGGVCEVIFEYTGSSQYFDVPSLAGNMTFEIYGASGGRGGNGGKITGELLTAPEELWVFVGGAGAVRANAPGGFNGGGAAGGSRGNEGSGGGASDIRIGQELEDRIAVAGGAGGGGGYSGAPGGNGGGLIGPNGGSAQGGGGLGGTQEAGGAAGRSNGGSPSEAGSFGAGGTGGSSWNSGGGGGGGGWYGGGAGGADSDSCCSDAGGGGGGSSYGSPEWTTALSHEVGVRSGSGRVILRYEILSRVTAFTATQQSKNEIEIQVDIEGDYSPSVEDFVLADESCQIVDSFVESEGFNFKITDCESDVFEASFASATSAYLASNGTNSVELALDRQGPTATLSQVDSDLVDYLLEVTTEEELFGLELGDFIVEGCQNIDFIGLKLSLSECQEGEISATLMTDSVEDSFGNKGPEVASIFATIRDTTPPTATWLTPTVTEVASSFSALVILEYEDFLREGATVSFLAEDESCIPEVTSEDNAIRFEITECGEGLLEWQLPALSLTDAAGNLGPVTALDLEIDLVFTPEPEPEPEPVPETAPEEEIESEPEQQETSSESDDQLERDAEAIGEQSSAAPAPAPPTPSAPAPAPKPVAPNPAPEKVDESIQEPVAEVPEQEVPSEDVVEELLEELENILEAELETVGEVNPEVTEPRERPLANVEPAQRDVVEKASAPVDQGAIDTEPTPVADDQLPPEVFARALEVNLISEEVAAEKPSVVQAAAPWVITVVILSALGFAAYRKMMVR